MLGMLFYRAILKATGQKVIVKTLSTLPCSTEDLFRLRHEFEILNTYKHNPGFPCVISLESISGAYALVCQDIGARSLDNYDDLSLKEILEISSVV
jgi:hypothetical protein